MTIYTNSGLVIDMQSAVGAAKTLTAISLAAPGVFTGTHDFVAGDIVLLEVEGMKEVNNNVYQVLSVSTTVSFQLEGVDGVTALDTSLYTAFVSGTAKKITLGTSVGGVSNYAPTGGEAKMVDTTTVSDLEDKQIVVGSTAQSYGFEMQWDPADAAQAAMSAAFTAGTPKAFRIRWIDGRFVLFYGTIGFANMPGGSTQGVTTTQCTIALKGGIVAGL